MFDPRHGKRGYATEALTAFLPRLFARWDSNDGAGSQAFDYAVAQVDLENLNSVRLLERCGWTRGEATQDAYTSPLLGSRDDITYRIARPGMELKDVMERIRKDEDAGKFVPDVM